MCVYISPKDHCQCTSRTIPINTNTCNRKTCKSGSWVGNRICVTYPSYVYVYVYIYRYIDRYIPWGIPQLRPTSLRLPTQGATPRKLSLLLLQWAEDILHHLHSQAPAIAMTRPLKTMPFPRGWMHNPAHSPRNTEVSKNQGSLFGGVVRAQGFDVSRGQGFGCFKLWGVGATCLAHACTTTTLALTGQGSQSRSMTLQTTKPKAFAVKRRWRRHR